jgi:NAD(P)-dependent dehydrogenase (short-subunit alcohol dehydrogenase family)
MFYPSHDGCQHDKITGLKCDMSDLKATTAAFNDIGDVDLLVNNAGIAYLAPFLEHDMDEFQR